MILAHSLKCENFWCGALSPRGVKTGVALDWRGDGDRESHGGELELRFSWVLLKRDWEVTFQERGVAGHWHRSAQARWL